MTRRTTSSADSRIGSRAIGARFPTGRTRDTVQPLICKSARMVEVARRIERAAGAESPVLICGERGAGKKLVAKTIHRKSPRRDGPFVTIRTGGAAGRPLDEELFGSGEWPGAWAKANGGTLLIDEITGLLGTAQARLLAILEGRPLADAGPYDGRRSAVRLMATTRFELPESVRRGVLRRELHYHLGVVTISVPSLRDRREDLPALIRHVLAEICAAREKPVPRVEPELMDCLVEYSWPGNGRQLRHCLETMLPERGADVLKRIHVPLSLVDLLGSSRTLASRRSVDTLADLERAAVARALEIHRGNRTRAAKVLGISVRTLQRKLRQWDRASNSRKTP